MSFDTERFIIEVQCRPSLWDTKSDDYSNRDLKKKCWEEVTDLFGGAEMGFGEKKELGLDLQKKWKGIRSCYAREIKRQKTVKSGCAAERKSEYIYFKQLQFLERVVAVRDTPVENIDTEDGTEEEMVRSKPSKKRKLGAATSDTDPFVTALNRSIESRERRDEDYNDEDRLFLLSLLSTLRSVPSDRKLTTKMKLMSVLQEAVQGVPSSNRNTSGYVDNSRVGYMSVSQEAVQGVPSSNRNTSGYVDNSRVGYINEQYNPINTIHTAARSTETSSTETYTLVLSPTNTNTSDSSQYMDLY